MELNNLRFGFGKRLPMVLQAEATECGLACLAMVQAYHGHTQTLRELRVRFPVSLKGTTLAHLAEIADQVNLIARPLRLELEELGQLQLPAILHWDLRHFVVLRAVRGKTAIIHDPASGELKLSIKQLSSHFSGVALELSPGLEFKRAAPKPPIGLRELAGNITGLKRGLLQLLALALVLEAFALIVPVLQQWLTDEALVRGDARLLRVICLGIIGVGLTTTAVSTIRSWVGTYISTNFNLQWMSNVMGRLLHLPVTYFEQRHVGDIMSRFSAVQSLEHGLTSAAIDAGLDGVMALGTLLMMFLYSPSLAAISTLAVALYVLLRYNRYATERMAAAGLIAKQAKEQSYFLETVRGARSIKLFNRINERRASWLNLRVDVVNANLALQRLSLAYGTGWGLLGTMERASVYWLGAQAVIENRITLGMLFAFLSFKEQFSARAIQLVNRVIEFKMLGVSAERLADIVLAAPEETTTYRKHDLPTDLTLSLERVSFRYSRNEPYLLRHADLSVSPGECVAIVGPSGCGKTTCLKLLLGILAPQQGQLKLGPIGLHQLGLQAYRDVIATVMQDDQLFSGSLYDNICFLDEKPDENWLYECARTAQVHDEIVAMPMGYQTLVGDMGTVLSGGQKQRVLLARALYRRPAILFLDEATSHLDLDNERKISAALAGLPMTRIMIAHRPQTIAIADRVLRLQGGLLVEDGHSGEQAILNLAANNKSDHEQTER